MFIGSLSFLLILTGLIFLPWITLKYPTRKKELTWLILILSPLVQLLLVTGGITIKASFFDNYTSLGWGIYYFCLLELSLQFFYLIYLAVYSGIRLINGLNEWNKKGIKNELIFLIIILVLYTILPDAVFALLYDFWGLLSIEHYKVGVGDSIYFAFAIHHSLPLSGDFASLQEQINVTPVLQCLQGAHIVVCQLIEYIMIGFTIARLMNLLNAVVKKQNDQDSSNTNFEL